MKMSNKTYPPNNKEESKRIADGFDRIFGKRDVLNKPENVGECKCGWKPEFKTGGTILWENCKER